MRETCRGRGLFQGASSPFRSGKALIALGAMLLTAGPAWSQTAADKATAREAATEGIGLYRAGKYADAIDRLRRAQALYDAPVHLLYIARAEDKLGQLVEAAENYRLLDRYALPPGAPEAWTAAVEDGRKELALLEPRVPKLRILAEPASPKDATLKIDETAVSAAVIGIARPVNPGKHHISLVASGFAPAEADVEVAESQSKDVALRLAASPGAAATPAAPSAKQPATAPSPEHRSLVGFMGGLRLGAGIPTGTLLHTPGALGRDVSVSEAFQPGAGLELHLGVRIARYFTPVLYIEGESLSAGSGLGGNAKIKGTTAGALGLGLIVGTPPGKLGGFGEFDLVPADAFALTVTVAGRSCSATAKGSAIRFGGGAVFPFWTWLHLTPFVTAMLGRFTSVDAPSCTAADFPHGGIDSGNRRTHGMLLLGVGGDVVLGRDK